MNGAAGHGAKRVISEASSRRSALLITSLTTAIGSSYFLYQHCAPPPQMEDRGKKEMGLRLIAFFKKFET